MSHNLDQMIKEYSGLSVVRASDMQRWKALLAETDYGVLCDNIIIDKAMDYPSRQGEKQVEPAVILEALEHHFASLNNIESMLTTDALTGIANKRGFEKGLQRCISRADRGQYANSGKCVAVIYIDVNNFKEEGNDRHGHNFGDEVLKYVGKGLENNTRKIDVAARMGGDEFAVVVDALPLKMADRYAKELTGRVNKHLQGMIKTKHPGKKADLSVSLGMSLLGKDAKSPEELIEHADIAMYQAKKCNKRNKALYRIYGEPEPKV